MGIHAVSAHHWTVGHRGAAVHRYTSSPFLRQRRARHGFEMLSSFHETDTHSTASNAHLANENISAIFGYVVCPGLKLQLRHGDYLRRVAVRGMAVWGRRDSGVCNHRITSSCPLCGWLFGEPSLHDGFFFYGIRTASFDKRGQSTTRRQLTIQRVWTADV